MGLFDSFKAALKAPAVASTPPSPVPTGARTALERLSLDDDVSVVGTSNYQAALKQVGEWTKSEGPTERYHDAVLEFEPTNPHDKNAIKVSVDGLLIGYIAKSDHRLMMHRMRKAGGVAIAEVVLIGGRDGKYIGAILR